VEAFSIVAALATAVGTDQGGNRFQTPHGIIHMIVNHRIEGGPECPPSQWKDL
jgi:hypothetical protein